MALSGALDVYLYTTMRYINLRFTYYEVGSANPPSRAVRIFPTNVGLILLLCSATIN